MSDEAGYSLAERVAFLVKVVAGLEAFLEALHRPRLVRVRAVDEDLWLFAFHTETEIGIRTEPVRNIFKAEFIELMVMFLRGVQKLVLLALKDTELRAPELARPVDHVDFPILPGNRSKTDNDFTDEADTCQQLPEIRVVIGKSSQMTRKMRRVSSHGYGPIFGLFSYLSSSKSAYPVSLLTSSARPRSPLPRDAPDALSVATTVRSATCVCGRDPCAVPACRG